jgi:hypothetical protein
MIYSYKYILLENANLTFKAGHSGSRATCIVGRKLGPAGIKTFQNALILPAGLSRFDNAALCRT